jgi:hypothetical protein
MFLAKYKTPRIQHIDSDLDANYAWVAAVDSGTQDDATTLAELDACCVATAGRYTVTVDADYKQVRSAIQSLIVAAIGADFSGWGSLTPPSRTIAARHFVVPKSQRDDVYTDSEQVDMGLLFHRSSVVSREERAAKLIALLYNRLARSDMDTTVDSISGLLQDYIRFGREGTASGDPDGLYDFLAATSGYAFTGLAAQSIVPITGTLADLVTQTLAILRGE